MTKTIRVIVVGLAFAILPFNLGCVSKNDVETLQIERRQDLNRIKQLEAELNESKELLRDEIEQSQTPVRQRAADMWAEIQSLRIEIAKLRGGLDTLNVRMDRQIGDSNSTITMSSLDNQLDEIEFILENQLQVDISKIKSERAQASDLHVSPLSINATAAEAPSLLPVSKDQSLDPAKALYDKAYELYKENQYEKARSYWAEFTSTFSGHPYSPSAFFWQGQCYYKLKDYARAAILFEDIIEKFPQSSKYKSALLKAGYSWGYLNKPELAKMRMDEIIKKFPKSVEATQAKRFLEKNN